VTRLAIAVVAAAALLTPAAASAQDAPDDAVLKLAEPDFTLIGLPTSLRLPRFGSAFRVTHRFRGPLNDDFGDVAGDLFGIDAGAQIGLEYRFGIVRNVQIGFHRTSDKTIEFFGQYGVLRQGGRRPFDVSATVAIDGTNNFRDSYSPTVGAVVSRTFGNVAAVYIEPMWVNNTNPLPRQIVDHNDTFMVGLGARVRIRPTVYLVGETAPRSGFKPGVTHGSFGIEKRAGGHVFQLNFSDGFGTTPSQIARGGPVEKDWFLGFNISRKFF
jgi:opacity protein-like surface antigen